MPKHRRECGLVDDDVADATSAGVRQRAIFTNPDPLRATGVLLLTTSQDASTATSHVQLALGAVM
jgi:hypothetical protein